ncbi:hypothetical protein EI94DRAFT_1734170, partial [Lactarius quietus]
MHSFPRLFILLLIVLWCILACPLLAVNCTQHPTRGRQKTTRDHHVGQLQVSTDATLRYECGVFPAI